MKSITPSTYQQATSTVSSDASSTNRGPYHVSLFAILESPRMSYFPSLLDTPNKKTGLKDILDEALHIIHGIEPFLDDGDPFEVDGDEMDSSSNRSKQ
eukprot:scaffold431_cov103-Cylindrotheca_fusiformis.AAC.6